MRPVKTVAVPPNEKRITYSYQRLSRSDNGEKRIGVMSALRRRPADQRRRSARRQAKVSWRKSLANASERGDGIRRYCRRQARSPPPPSKGFVRLRSWPLADKRRDRAWPAPPTAQLRRGQRSSWGAARHLALRRPKRRHLR